MTRRPIRASWAEAPAKINLGLVVTGMREDGYHSIDFIFLRLALHDHLEVRPAADPDGPDELLVSGDPRVPIEDNLVLRAVAALRRSVGGPLPALRIRLEKHIPMGAGLGGGSSDAAAALRLASQVWGLSAEEVASRGLAAGVGADVPFFLSGHAAARARGIGEILDALPVPAPAVGVLLVTPRSRLLTGAVFAALGEGPGSAGDGAVATRVAAIDDLEAGLRTGLDGAALEALAPRLRDANGLWAPATRLLPDLPAMRDGLEARLGRAVLLTGSGPTLVALYPSADAAAAAARSLAELRGPREAATIIATATSRGGPS